VVEVENSQALVPSAFIFLHHNHLFLTFSNRQVTVWDFEGKIVTRYASNPMEISSAIANSALTWLQQTRGPLAVVRSQRVRQHGVRVEQARAHHVDLRR